MSVYIYLAIYIYTCHSGYRTPLIIFKDIFGLVSCRFQPDVFEICSFTKKYWDFSKSQNLALQSFLCW